ncbi:phenoloxidase-activating factor 2-like [Epargyreus clarus]|uniref:phenoloxidase-activating factor 2-like n=1 Tax=Epargyreus clarus TaxID=520877 RepID=UPI003C2FA5A6
MRFSLLVFLVWTGYEVDCKPSPNGPTFGQTLNIGTSNKTNIGKSACITNDGKTGSCVETSICRPKFVYRSSSDCNENECCVAGELNNKFENVTSIDTVDAGDSGLTVEPSPRSHSNDTETEFGEFPFAIALHNTPEGETVSKESFIGVGTLIHISVVLTAAHKVENLEKIQCRAGEWLITEEDETFYHFDRKVKKIVLHNDYEYERYRFDAALLFLEKPFFETKYVKVVCLGEHLPPSDTPCFSMGWGNSFTDPNSSALKKVQMTTLNLARCQRQLRNTHLTTEFGLHHSLMCAGLDSVDPCIGDGGAPLVCSLERNGNKPVVYGMAVYNVFCGRRGLPWVFAKVPALVPWLRTELQKEGVNATYC